jgi:hypothetical protein
MYGVNPEAIKKKKKGEVPMETISTGAMSEMVGAKSSKSDKPIEGVKPSKSMPHPEAKLELELMLKDSKKSPSKENAFTKDLGYFEVEKDKKGIFKESGESRAKYLRKLKSMKK